MYFFFFLFISLLFRNLNKRFSKDRSGFLRRLIKDQHLHCRPYIKSGSLPCSVNLYMKYHIFEYHYIIYHISFSAVQIYDISYIHLLYSTYNNLGLDSKVELTIQTTTSTSIIKFFVSMHEKKLIS